MLKRFRSSITGRWVTRTQAHDDPAGTISETATTHGARVQAVVDILHAEERGELGPNVNRCTLAGLIIDALDQQQGR
jgi:hypothetical protein